MNRVKHVLTRFFGHEEAIGAVIFEIRPSCHEIRALCNWQKHSGPHYITLVRVIIPWMKPYLLQASFWYFNKFHLIYNNIYVLEVCIEFFSFKFDIDFKIHRL